MLSLAETKSTEPRRRDISEAAAVEVPTAVPWITSKMLAESTAEMRYSLMEAGICRGKCHCAGVSLSFPLLCRAGRGLSPLPALCCACSSPSPGTSAWLRTPKTSSCFSLCPELLEKVNKLQGGITRPAPHYARASLPPCQDTDYKGERAPASAGVSHPLSPARSCHLSPLSS